jgi:NAD(P)-dependent dehydrogenase (short-subunit alcohol dehydrogenase family)
MKHKDQCVVVTGGASGIGAAIADRFQKEGAHVCILDINAEALASAQKANHFPLCIHCDVSDRSSICSAFDQIGKKWKSIDVLVNNAGISIREPFETTSLENWNRTLAVNLTGPFLVSQETLRFMKTGVMIHIASVSGMVGMPNYLSYNVSKAGVIELTKTLALELAPSIRVNCISPGYVLTPMQRKEYTPQAILDCASKIPMKRLGRPEEIAALASYLASSEAEFATGQSFVIDGGETAGGLAS